MVVFIGEPYEVNTHVRICARAASNGGPYRDNLSVSIVAGLFNDDGRDDNDETINLFDIVIVNEDDDSVTVLINSSDGRFSDFEEETFDKENRIRTYDVEDKPQHLIVVDLNNDGLLDLAVSNIDSEDVSVLLGKGDGTFSNDLSPIRVGSKPEELTAYDFDDDGRIDLAVANRVNDSVTFLPGLGDGTFQGKSFLLVGQNPQDMIAVDLDSDDFVDLITVNKDSDDISVLLSNGDGTFDPFDGSNHSTGSSPIAIAAADFDGDGRIDIVVANKDDNTLAFLRGHGDGGFDPAVIVALDGISDEFETFTPLDVAVGEFNGDNFPEIVVSGNVDREPNGKVLILYGDGNLSETSFSDGPTVFTVEKVPGSLIVGFFNNNPSLDIAIANRQSSSVSILFDPSPENVDSLPNSIEVGTGPEAIASGDYDNDGQIDLFTFNAQDNTVSILLGDGNGFSKLDEDITRDNFEMIHPEIALELGLDADEFPVEVISNRSRPISQANGQFNDDNNDDKINEDDIPDLVIANEDSGSVSIALGSQGENGEIEFNFSSRIVVGSNTAFVTVGDFNHDNKDDLAVANEAESTVTILLGDGNGFFTIEEVLAVGNGKSKPVSILVANLNGDGVDDLTIANRKDSISIFYGKKEEDQVAGESLFYDKIDIKVDSIKEGEDGENLFDDPRSKIVAGHFNDDNGDNLFNDYDYMDLAIPNEDGNDVRILLGSKLDDGMVLIDSKFKKDGDEFEYGFTDGGKFEVGQEPRSIVIGDFDHDGKDDLATSNEDLGTVSVLLGKGDGTFEEQIIFLVGDDPEFIEIGDIDGDGHDDLITTNDDTNDISILYGKGSREDGLFELVRSINVGEDPKSLTIANFDQDQDNVLDIVVNNTSDDEIVFLFGAGDSERSTTFH